jgi:phosphoglycolate phosphatase-like HAD superfamily hydrolase
MTLMMRRTKTSIPVPLLVLISVVPVACYSTSRSCNTLSAPFWQPKMTSMISKHSASSINIDDTTTMSTITPIYNNVKAILFDVDGTIADSGQLGFDATQVVLENNQYDRITYEEYCNGCIYITPDRLARHVGLTPEKDGPIFCEVGQRLGQEFDNFYIDLVSIETAAFFPGILQLLERIPSNLPLGVLTNAAGRYAHGVIKANDMTSDGTLYERFGCILGADDVPKPKPYGDGLLQLCSVLQVNPTECVYIGDSPTDGLAATAAGMPSIGVTWGAHKTEKLQPHVTHLCNSVDELAAILPQIR